MADSGCCVCLAPQPREAGEPPQQRTPQWPNLWPTPQRRLMYRGFTRRTQSLPAIAYEGSARPVRYAMARQASAASEGEAMDGASHRLGVRHAMGGTNMSGCRPWSQALLCSHRWLMDNRHGGRASPLFWCVAVRRLFWCVVVRRPSAARSRPPPFARGAEA